MNVIPRFRFALKPEEISEMLEKLDEYGEEQIGEIDKFEKQFADFLKRKYAIFLPSARFGLYHTLKALGLKKGDGVIVPAWTHYSVPSMIVAAGMRPLFADIEAGSFNMSHTTIPKKYLNEAKAVIITHLYGFPAKAKEIKQLADQHGLVTIEDCAQSLGAKIDGKLTGTFGHASYFSLSITKNLTTLKGGMVCTDDDGLAKHLKDCRLKELAKTEPLKKVLKTCNLAHSLLNPVFFTGMVYPGLLVSTAMGIDPIHEKFREKMTIENPGDKTPFPHPVQALLGQRQLDVLKNHNEARHTNGKFLIKRLKGKIKAGLPVLDPKNYEIFMSLVISVNDPWKVKKALLKRGIDSSPGYLCDCASMDIFKDYEVNCPNAREMAKKQLHIPVYPGLTEKQLEKISGSLLFAC